MILYLHLLLMVLPCMSLSPISHCINTLPPNHCRCTATPPVPQFCLSSSPLNCIQHPCPATHVCDCAGDTLCRIQAAPPAHVCLRPLAADGTCPCTRRQLSPPPPSKPLQRLIPLRPYKSLEPTPQGPFCTERPTFWASSMGAELLRLHWERVARMETGGKEIRIGRPGHQVVFHTPDALIRAMGASILDDDGMIVGTQHDPDQVGGLVSECMSLLLAVRLAEVGVGTRVGMEGASGDVGDRWVVQGCGAVHTENRVAGMSVRRVLERAMWVTGERPEDEGGVSRDDVEQACRAVNRNFELCQVDLGCVAVMEM